MPTIAQHIDEIRNLDVGNHTIRDIKKKNWDWLNFPEKDALYGAIFVNDVINLSRAEVKAETDIKTKIMKVLMWGYKKTNGSLRPQYFDSIVNHLNVLEPIFADIQNRNLNAEERKNFFTRLRTVNGLGQSTYSKLLYFFNVSFEDKKCLILDTFVIANLKVFDEFSGINWVQSQNCYLTYLNKIDELAGLHNVSPEQLERFLFGYRS